MESPNPKIVSVERMDGSVVVSFEDGQTALYSAALLYEMRTRARDLTDLACDDD
jgi:hypothetical protein